jgi:cobalamin biosynthesis protein CbiG
VSHAISARFKIATNFSVPVAAKPDLPTEPFLAKPREAVPSVGCFIISLAASTIDGTPVNIDQEMNRDITLWMGIGCQRGTAYEWLEQSIAHLCHTHQISFDTIAGIATLDRKAQEPAIQQLCRNSITKRHLSLRTFTAAQLAAVPTGRPSATAQAIVGTASVAEAAALLAAAPAQLWVGKQIFRQAGSSVTLAIAKTLTFVSIA